MRCPWFLFTASALAVVACSGGGSGGTDLAPPQKGNRLLGMAVTTAEDGDFDGAIQTARAAGMEVATLALGWDDLETADGVFDPDPDWLDIAAAYYPAAGLRLALELNPIDTNHWRVPAWHAALPIDDAQVIAAYEALLDWALPKVAGVDLVDLAIGNEIDATLADDADAWARYTTFFTAVAQHARALRPGLRVGAKLTLDGLVGANAPLAAGLLAQADVVQATVYPLAGDFTVLPPGSIHALFDDLVAHHPGRTILVREMGYPSGALCASSEARQASFVREAFDAWDEHRHAIELCVFVWTTDLSPGEVDALKTYYGIDDPAFLEFLATLGLRTFAGAGADKAAFRALDDEAHARGW